MPPKSWRQLDVLDRPEARPAALPAVHTNGAIAARSPGQQSLNAPGIRRVEISGLDDIDLSGIGVRQSLTGDQAFGFSGTTAAAFSVRYTAGRSEVIVRGDMTGDRTADFEIRLMGMTALTAGNFIL